MRLLKCDNCPKTFNEKERHYVLIETQGMTTLTLCSLHCVEILVNKEQYPIKRNPYTVYKHKFPHLEKPK